VGFRGYVFSMALSLGVRGEVWNRRDGAVEALFEHDERERLERFENGLRHGPGYVEAVMVEEWNAPLEMGEFTVGPTR
jgi:acylphosphatase